MKENDALISRHTKGIYTSEAELKTALNSITIGLTPKLEELKNAINQNLPLEEILKSLSKEKIEKDVFIQQTGITEKVIIEQDSIQILCLLKKLPEGENRVLLLPSVENDVEALIELRTKHNNPDLAFRANTVAAVCIGDQNIYFEKEEGMIIERKENFAPKIPDKILQEATAKPSPLVKRKLSFTKREIENGDLHHATSSPMLIRQNSKEEGEQRLSASEGGFLERLSGSFGRIGSNGLFK